MKTFNTSGCTGYDTLLLPERKRLPLARATGRQPAHRDDSEQIGRFSFSRSTLQKVNIYLQELVRCQVRYILIDEIGRLEMAGKGLAPSVEQVLVLPPGGATSVFLVVQQQVLPAFLKKYRPGKYQCINLDIVIPRCYYS